MIPYQHVIRQSAREENANISTIWQDHTANVLDGPRRKTTALAASLASIARIRAGLAKGFHGSLLSVVCITSPLLCASVEWPPFCGSVAIAHMTNVATIS